MPSAHVSDRFVFQRRVVPTTVINLYDASKQSVILLFITFMYSFCAINRESTCIRTFCVYVQKTPLGPVYTKRQRQCCDDACDSVLIENNGVAPEWVRNPFSSDSTVLNENKIASIIAALTLPLGVNGPLRCCSFILFVQLTISYRREQTHISNFVKTFYSIAIQKFNNLILYTQNVHTEHKMYTQRS